MGHEEQLETMLPRHNLPPRDYQRFVGRQDELAQLHKLLLPYPRSRYHLVTIDGIGGIGKSALALETAWQLVDGCTTLPEAERFAAIVWVSAKRTFLTAEGIKERQQSFQNLRDLFTAIAQVLDFPAITRARAEEQRAIVEQVLGEQRTLLVLDNLETIDDEELLAFLRDMPDPTKALMTTRHRVDVAYPLRLSGLPYADALALIGQESQRKGVALVEAEREELWARTGGVPLAIVWSVALIGSGAPTEDVLRRLGQGQSDIARFCFAESVATIQGRDAYWILLALSLFATDASREALGEVAGLGEDTFGRDRGLEELLRLSLVNKNGDRFSLLPLTRSFVQGETEQCQTDIEAMHTRLQDYFYDLVKQFGGWSKDWSGQDRVELELPNILLAIELMHNKITYTKPHEYNALITCESEFFARKLIKFITNTSQTCRIRGHWMDHERLSLLRLHMSRALSSQEEMGWSYYELSKLNHVRRDFKALYYWAAEARIAGQQSGQELLFLLASRHFGEAALFLGNLSEAAVILPDTLLACQKTGLSWLPRHLYGSMGKLAEAQGDFEKAADWYGQAINSFESDNSNLALFLLLLGQLKLKIGALEQATIYLHKSLAQAEESGRSDVIALAHLSLAKLDLAEHRSEHFAKHTYQALDLFRRLGMRQEQAEAEALLRQIGEQP